MIRVARTPLDEATFFRGRVSLSDDSGNNRLVSHYSVLSWPPSAFIRCSKLCPNLPGLLRWLTKRERSLNFRPLVSCVHHLLVSAARCAGACVLSIGSFYLEGQTQEEVTGGAEAAKGAAVASRCGCIRLPVREAVRPAEYRPARPDRSAAYCGRPFGHKTTGPTELLGHHAR